MVRQHLILAYDRCYCHVVYIHNVVGRCYLPMDMMAKIAFVTDVIVTYVSVADGDHIFEIINVMRQMVSHMYLADVIAIVVDVIATLL